MIQTDVKQQKIHKKMNKITAIIVAGGIVTEYMVSAQSELPEKSPANGFAFEAAYISDYAGNYAGAVKKGRCYLGLIDIGVSFNTENAGLWRGGEFFLQVENTHGGMPTAEFVNDFQVFSNIENGDNTCLYMAWIKQDFGKFSFLAGLHDLNSVFQKSEYAGLFINSSFGIMSIMAVNIPVPIFPKTAPGFITGYQPAGQISFKTAVYDGDPGSFETDPYNLNQKISKDEGLLSVSEIHFKSANSYNSLKAGFYYHSAEFNSYADTNITIKGNYGIYLIGDKLLLPKSGNDGQGLACFLQLGCAPAKINFNNLYIGAGLSYQGLFMNKFDDALGIAVAYAKVCDRYLNRYDNNWKPDETAIEVTYLMQFSENIAVQPDIQYIINPGAQSSLDNALTGLIRLNIGF